MVHVDFLFVLLITIVVTALFSFGFRRGGTWSWIALYFFVVFFGTWAVGAWLPLGPRVWDSAWLAYLVAAVVLAALFGWAMPRRAAPPLRAREFAEPSAAQREAKVEGERTVLAVTASMLLFFGGMIVALLAVVAHYALDEPQQPAHAVEQDAPAKPPGGQ